MPKSFRITAPWTLVVAAMLAAGAAEGRELVIYTANYRISDALVAAYQSQNPELEINAISGSTGPIAERAIAEMGNPQADVVYLLNEPTLTMMRDAGVFEPYEPRASPIPAEHRDPDGFFTNFMMNAMVMLVNTDRLAERELPMATSWEDLLNPVYEGEINIASPAKSGTGYTIYTTLWDAFGWNYMDYLDANVFTYNDGGGAAGQQAGAGEIAIGLTHDAAAFEQKAAGRPVEIVFPTITPANYEGGGLVVGAPNPEEGKRFLDWVASEEAAAIVQPFVTASTVPGYTQVPEGNRQFWRVQRPVDRDVFLEEWTKRFAR
ncbi:MAG: extracellular solute-binding protein [Pseudomonadota bacterium]